MRMFLSSLVLPNHHHIYNIMTHIMIHIMPSRYNTNDIIYIYTLRSCFFILIFFPIWVFCICILYLYFVFVFILLSHYYLYHFLCSCHNGFDEKMFSILFVCFPPDFSLSLIYVFIYLFCCSVG